RLDRTISMHVHCWRTSTSRYNPDNLTMTDGAPRTAALVGHRRRKPDQRADRSTRRRQDVPMSHEDGSDRAAPDLARAGRARRSHRGLPLDALSRRTGLSKGFLSQMEGGEANPTLNTLTRLTDALRLPLAELFAGGVVDPAPAGADRAEPDGVPEGEAA